jgi:hypothetical protein
VWRDTDEIKRSREVVGLIDDWDRTLEVPIVILAMFTPDYVRHVQKTVLREYPLWRLCLVGTKRDGEESLMIYPEAVCIGNVRCPPGNLETELCAWRERMAQIRDRHGGCRTRQWRYVFRALPVVLTSDETVTVKGISAFDNWEGDFDVCNVWVVQRGYYARISRADDVKGVAVTPVFINVDAAGAKCRASRDANYFSVVQYTFPKASGRDSLILCRKFDGQRWEIPIDARAIITDEQLKAEAVRKNERSFEPLLMPAPPIATGP